MRTRQRRTGAIIHNGSRWLKSQVRIEGEHKIYARKGDSGSEIRFHFCPNCGSSVFWEGRSVASAGIDSLRARGVAIDLTPPTG